MCLLCSCGLGHGQHAHAVMLTHAHAWWWPAEAPTEAPWGWPPVGTAPVHHGRRAHSAAGTTTPATPVIVWGSAHPAAACALLELLPCCWSYWPAVLSKVDL